MLTLTRGIVIASAAVAVAIAGTILYWLKPQELGLPTAEAWAAFQPGSVVGIVIWSTFWLAPTVVLVAVAWWRLRVVAPQGGSDFLIRGASWCAACFATAAVLSVLPFISVDLALEHLVESSKRESLAWGPLSSLIIVGLVLIPAALLLSSLSAVVRGHFKKPRARAARSAPAPSASREAKKNRR